MIVLKKRKSQSLIRWAAFLCLFLFSCVRKKKVDKKKRHPTQGKVQEGLLKKYTEELKKKGWYRIEADLLIQKKRRQL